MWVGGPPNPMQPRRSHSLPMVPRVTGDAGRCPLTFVSCSWGLVAEHLIGQLLQLALGRHQSLSSFGRCHIGTANPTIDNMWSERRRPSASILCRVG